MLNYGTKAIVDVPSCMAKENRFVWQHVPWLPGLAQDQPKPVHFGSRGCAFCSTERSPSSRMSIWSFLITDHMYKDPAIWSESNHFGRHSSKGTFTLYIYTFTVYGISCLKSEIIALESLRQEGCHEFKVYLGHIICPCQNTKTKLL